MRNRRFNRLTFVLLAVTFNMSQVSAEDRPKFLVLELDIDFTNGRDVLQEVMSVVPRNRHTHGIPPVGSTNLVTSQNFELVQAMSPGT